MDNEDAQENHRMWVGYDTAPPVEPGIGPHRALVEDVLDGLVGRVVADMKDVQRDAFLETVTRLMMHAVPGITRAEAVGAANSGWPFFANRVTEAMYRPAAHDPVPSAAVASDGQGV